MTSLIRDMFTNDSEENSTDNFSVLEIIWKVCEKFQDGGEKRVKILKLVILLSS